MQRPGKRHLIGNAHRVRRIGGRFAVAVQREFRAGRAFHLGQGVGRRLEDDCAGQQCLQRFGLDLQALRPDRGLHAGGDPKLAAGSDQRAVRLVDKDVDRHRAVLIGQRVIHDLADLHPMKIDRRGIADRRHPFRRQGEDLAVDEPLRRRRIVKAAEIAGAKMVSFDKCGHVPAIEKTEEFLAAVTAFLGGGAAAH